MNPEYGNILGVRLHYKNQLLYEKSILHYSCYVVSRGL